ncbi:MAG TPA: lysylphosphatidylglycerol synthase transmembrane domain-containing protein [Candidatus Saccharimonadales bacterium]|nr:lysylphosphatidylglycerol synthase transmembrane domain-containing protein [Candidatus Saccharimonadales bacterium]
MEATPALDPRAVGASPDPVAPAAALPPDPERVPDADQMSIGRRLRQPRTIISILVPFFIIGAFVAINGAALARVPGLVLAANGALVLVAFLVFYAGFPLRGLRWKVLLRGASFQIGTKDSTEIIFLSWLVNCVVPAKLGDLYRAYLLKINSTNASLSRTFGTVFIERVLDLVAIALLGILAGWWSFRDGLPPAIQAVFGVGLVVVAALSLGLFTMRNFGRRIIVALPFLPHRLLELYDRFEEGVFGAVAVKQLPILGVLTGSIWLTEGLRLFFVVQALGFQDVELGLSGAIFVALIGSLLTAVPLSPAGLGIVEAGVIGVLTVAYGVPLPEATAIALLDRVISVFSVIVLGSIAYFFSNKPRGLGHIGEPLATSTPASTPV